jgi:peptidoglycan hydrolase-like protein with peptidoglycan-binding domain
MLVLLGYFSSPVDGQYQASTEAAVKKFQQDVGLNSDGIVGPATWSKLLPTPSTDFNPPEVVATPASDNGASEPAPDTAIDLPTLRQGMSGPAVSRIQETLKARGFYTGPIDGAFGPMTETAVMDFQREAGLAADGVVGPATWSALLR